MDLVFQLLLQLKDNLATVLTLISREARVSEFNKIQIYLLGLLAVSVFGTSLLPCSLAHLFVKLYHRQRQWELCG